MSLDDPNAVQGIVQSNRGEILNKVLEMNDKKLHQIF